MPHEQKSYAKNRCYKMRRITDRTIFLLVLLCISLHGMAQYPIAIEASAGRYSLSAQTRIEVGGHNHHLSWSGIDWLSCGGLEISSSPIRGLVIGVNGFLDGSLTDTRRRSRNLSRAHAYIEVEGQIGTSEWQKDHPNVFVGARFAVGRIGGANRSVPEGAMNYGLGLHVGWQFADRWSTVLRSTVYWHKEKQVASAVYIHQYRLAGIRAGIRYSINSKHRSPQSD